ncbi:MAG TPA: hypothetical protein VMW26_06240 [Methanomassiliicoccales archaeon]|nr:hypothetical protein [Methanomassiliicoccales archaeon]
MSNSRCTRCGEPIQEWSRYCSRCGWKLVPSEQAGPTYQESQYPRPNYQGSYYPPPYYRSWVKEKDPGTVLLLALILGLIGFMGIGHLYIGKIARGVVLLIFGLIIAPMFAAAMMYLMVSGMGYIDETVIIPFIVLTIIWLIVLIWQTYDAHELAKRYNYVLRTTGLPPW